MARVAPLAASRDQLLASGARVEHTWLVCVLLGAYAALTYYLQRSLWHAAAQYEHLSTPLVAAIFIAALATVAAIARLAPLMLEQLGSSFGTLVSRHERLLAAALVVCAALLPALIATVTLNGFPNSGDEYAYAFQAEQFARGRLWAPAPPLDYSLVAYRTWIIGDKWVSQYPPGWPAFLALALRLHLPGWAASVALGAGSAALLFATSWQTSRPPLRIAAAATYVLSLFYLLNAASFYSHVLSAVLITLVCLTCIWYERTQRARTLLLCGALLGLIGITRYFSLVLLLPALGWFLVRQRGRQAQLAALIVLGALPFLAALLAYQDAITGDPLRSSYSVIADHDIPLSLQPQAVLHGLQLSAHQLAELGLWSTPLLPVALLVCLCAKWQSRSLAFHDLVLPSFVFGYVFFADLGGNRYGPRYYFDAYPLLLVTLFSTRVPHRSWTAGLLRAPLLVSAVLVSLLYMLIALPLALGNYHEQVVQRAEVYRLSTQQGLQNAIVIVQNSVSRGLRAVDLARNDAQLNGRVLYARPDTSVSELQRAFPGRSIWAYRHDKTRAYLWQLAAPAH